MGIYIKGKKVVRWMTCPLYDRCLQEMTRIKSPPYYISWTCSECEVFLQAPSDQTLEFISGKPKAFELKELWEHIWTRKNVE